MWLTGRFIPDFKTIDDSRKDNGAAIQAGRHSPSRASRAGLAAVTAPPGAGTRTAIQIMTKPTAPEGSRAGPPANPPLPSLLSGKEFFLTTAVPCLWGFS
jgi:hypothetical protein